MKCGLLEQTSQLAHNQHNLVQEPNSLHVEHKPLIDKCASLGEDYFINALFDS